MTEDTQNPITPQEFAKKVKAKYPQYENIDDITLAKKMVEKYPEYSSQVNFDSNVKKKGSLESATLQPPKTGTTGLPVADGSSVTPAPIKEEEDEEEDYFTGSFGNVLRGFDNIVPLGIGDFVDDMARSVSSGYRQGTVAEAADKLLLKGHKATPEQLQKFIDANKEAQQIKPSAEMQDYTKIYEEEGKGFWGVVKGLANNPSIIPEVMSSSLISMATNTHALTSAGAAVGAGATYGAITGAAATPVVAGAGAIPGAIAGAASSIPYAFGLASTVVETGATFGELLTEELKGKEMTKESVRAILENPDKLQSIRNKAIARGIVIGTLDALTGKLASGVGAKILTKSAAKSAAGVATKAAVVKSTAVGSGIEAVGGSFGEAAARVATGQEMDVSEIALEGIAELPGGVRSTIQARLAKPSYEVNGEKVTAEDIDELTKTMTPEQLSATKIVIKNDYEGRMFKIQDKVVTNSVKEQVRQANPNLNEPSLNAITELEKELKGLEGNKTQTGKDKSSLLRNQIKDIQENQLADEVVSEVKGSFEFPEDEKIAKLEAELETIADDNNPRIAEIDAEISKLETIKTEQDAVQEQSTTEIPVQSEAGVSETMEEGKPESKPEDITEQGKQEEVVEPLKDRESTAKALETADDDAYVKILNDYFIGGNQETTTEDVSNSYHSSKENNGNPELVKAVEELLAPKAEVTEPLKITREKVREVSDEDISSLYDEIPLNYMPINENTTPQDAVFEAYFKSKRNNKNPELVEAVEALLVPKAEVTPPETIITEQAGPPPVPEGFDIVTEAFPIQAQESRVKSAQSLLNEAKTKAAKKKAMTDLVKEQGKLAEMKAFEKVAASEVDNILNLDTTDKTNLKKVADFLESLDRALDLDPNELNDVTRVMTIATAKLVVKALKALINTGITLQEALKKVAADNNLKISDVTKGINALSEVAKIPEKYNELMAKADKLIARQKKRGISEKQIVSNLDKMVRKSDVYTDEKTNDAQRKIMEREVRAKMGVAPRKAPSIGRVLGVLNDIKNVSREEKLKIISRIRELSKDAAKDLIEEIRELASGGRITPTQSINIIAKFSKVNMLNEISVSNFVDYMTKVFADAEYDNKIDVAKSKLKAAKKNINTKIGIANVLAFPLQTLFSINPSLIPIKNLERYMELVKMFSDRKAVLQLDEISKVTNDVNEILDEINNEQSLVPELSYRLNNSENQELKDGELDYAATIKKMIANGEITQDEADLMVKYKKEISPKPKKTEEELEQEKEELEKEKKELIDGLKKSTVNASDLPTRDERSIAKRISEHLKKPFINQLSNVDLKNLIRAIDNVNNGYLPHQALLILEKLDGFAAAKTEVNVINRANLSTITKIYNSIKSKLTGRDVVFEMIRRAPLFNIDQVLGNFKTQELFDALLGKTAQGEARFSFALKTIEEKLKNAQDKVAKSFGLDPYESTVSSYKIKTYQLQLEYESNPGDARVNPAAKYIQTTIKHINKLQSQYNENDVKILEDILNKFAPEGDIDIKKLYNSFNSAEKNAIKVLQEIKKEETEKAEFTAAVIRGKRINPLNNHTHISVLSEDSKSDLDSGASFADDYNRSLNPSTKAKSLIERTPGVKPINFDAYSTAHKSAKYVLLDYHLTSPIRTAKKSLRTAEIELEKDGQMPKEQRKIFNSVKDSFDLAVKDLVMNSYMQTSIGSDIVNYISKQGYRAVLAGLGKSVVELISNIGFVAFDPFTFSKGVEYSSILLSEDGPAIMNNVGSVQTNRVYASGLSGRMVDTGILNQSVGTKSSKTRGKIINKAQQIWNLTGKKGLNAVELTADALITSPDKLVMRPYWIGSFAVEFKKETGNEPDFKKIAENNEGYMNENESVIKKSREVADRKSALMGATKNGFTGLLRGKIRAEDNAGVAIVKNFNSFMTNFMIYEYTAAKTGVMAAIGQGTMTKSQGAAVLAGVVTRMTVYNLLINAATVGVSGLLGLAFGGDDEEDEEKTIGQLTTKAITSTFATLMLGRDFGNVSKTVVNYAFEELVTKEYLEGLRTGEYDPYKDSILRTSLQSNEKTGEIELYENIPNFMGSYSPIAKTAALGLKVLTSPEKKEAGAIERQEKERDIRLPLEILGNMGLVPLYKEVRKAVMDNIYKDLKSGGGISEEELKRTDPKMYQIMYGKD